MGDYGFSNRRRSGGFVLVKSLTKNEKKVFWIMTVTVILAIVIFVGVLYVNDYYKATEKAKEAIVTNETVDVVEEDGYFLFDLADKDTNKGIIFYPGGKVEETAYAPLLSELAECGYEVYLVKMPAKLAIFGMDSAEEIMESATHIEEWTMMGHSLGGAMAASFCDSHDEEVDTLVLLAAYSTANLTDNDIQVFSFYGSEDKVLNMEKYKDYRSNLGDDTIEEVIDGGNHAYYGYYGEQDGDGTATITREEQQECVIDIFLNYN